tara:strand:- start:181 stop:663 length:483 start_codon:yes stop_codon:yes gene_type:complete
MALDNFEDYNSFVTSLIIGQSEKAAIDIESYINQLRISGATDDTILALLLADLDEGGRIFGAVTNGVVNTVKANVNVIGNVASMATYEQAGVQEFQWIVVNGKNACPDCIPRDGRVESMEFWTAIGTPGSGWSVCREHCNCELAPVDYSGRTTFDKPQIK